MMFSAVLKIAALRLPTLFAPAATFRLRPSKRPLRLW
ncbi:hypothetical protein X759_07030 [Mesorhizobium sp. LSHC420B00]|nr:hypothetical protein X759_07030 [Mesorhizobium sp. LSHC420B00]